MTSDLAPRRDDAPPGPPGSLGRRDARPAAAGRLLGFPEDKTCAFLITLGYPAGRPLAPVSLPDRRPFDEVVHWGRW